jgi:hypothetical protein
MIQNINLGDKCKDVSHVQFGSGDILMSQLELDSHKHSLGLAFYPGRNVGDTTKEFIGLTSDEMPCEFKVVLSFSNPESVTALIHSLLDLQKRIFDDKLKI